ncbi:hypothetical protein [Haliangium sp.]|uniref:hypothetical protein n=1 Tax=Haliangium sp. TaxID=2663208 RepID=UPI003D0F0525
MSHAKPERTGYAAIVHAEEAQRALDRAMQLQSTSRMERLVSLSAEYPNHGPTWLALAEEHAARGRNEEAAGALRRALKLDPSLRQDISNLLRAAGYKVLDEMVAQAASAPAAGASHPGAGGTMLSHDGRLAPAGADPVATAALAEAMKLPEAQRCNRLADLALIHPAHGPTWLALAEEHLAGRRVEYAVSAYERALSIDPTLHTLASRKLEAVRRYHKRVRLDVLPNRMQRTVPPPTHAAPSPQIAPKRPQAETVRPNRALARGTSPPPAERIPSPNLPAKPDFSDSSMHAALAQALELPERDRRLDALRTLDRRAPETPAVMFHLALELALAGEAEAARTMGDRLMRLSPQYYRRLYEVAERHWPSQSGRRLAGVGAKAVEPTKILTLPPALQEPTTEAAPPMVAPAMRTQVLPEMIQPSPHLLTLGQPMYGAQPGPGRGTALMALPTPPVHDRSGRGRALAFLAAGLLLGVLVVVLLNWALPGEPESFAPRPTRAAPALATSGPDAPTTLTAPRSSQR